MPLLTPIKNWATGKPSTEKRLTNNRICFCEAHRHHNLPSQGKKPG
jgi:hypothetical protein